MGGSGIKHVLAHSMAVLFCFVEQGHHPKELIDALTNVINKDFDVFVAARTSTNSIELWPGQKRPFLGATNTSREPTIANSPEFFYNIRKFWEYKAYSIPSGCLNLFLQRDVTDQPLWQPMLKTVSVSQRHLRTLSGDPYRLYLL